MPEQNVNPTLSLSPNCVSKLFNTGYITNLTSHIHTCRFHSWAGGFESRLPSVDFYNMGSVDHFRKHPQTTEYINCQEYRQQATKAGADCYALQGTCNQLNFIVTLKTNCNTQSIIKDYTTHITVTLEMSTNSCKIKQC